jgi:alpha-N-arabinofuranosidase
MLSMLSTRVRLKWWRRRLCTASMAFVLATAPLVHAQSPGGEQIVETNPQPAVVTVHVDAAADGPRVPAELFGSFLEPIGNSINNGLVAQILVNPSLEGGLWSGANLQRIYNEEPELLELQYLRGLPVPWFPWERKAGNRYEVHVGKAANSYQSVELLGTPAASAGLMQRIYLPVHRTHAYLGTVYARRIQGTGKIAMALRKLNGQVVATVAINAQSTEWTKYRAELRVPEGAIQPLEKVEFGVYVEDDGWVEIDQVMLTPADAWNGLDPDALKLAKEMGMTELRLGGNFSSYYHWQDGIGDPDKRLAMINIAWGIPEYNNFGTDEFLALCRELKVIPQFDLNMGSGTSEEANAWVRYIRQRYQGRILWEIGNELWGPWQVGALTLDQIPDRTLAFSKAVRAADPDAEIIVTGDRPQEFEKWHAALLTLPQDTFRYLSIHFVETSRSNSTWKPHTENSAYMVYAKTFHVGETFDQMLAQVDSTAHHGKVHFAMTEWLFNSMGPGERNFTTDYPGWINQGGAVAAAGLFNSLLRHTNALKIADMTGMMEFAGIWKKRERVYAQPSYYVFQMYARSKGETLLPVTSDSGTYRVTEKNYAFPGFGDVPYLDVVATKSADDKRVMLLAVNRSSKASHVRLDLHEFPASAVELTDIAAANRYERNTEEDPQHIHPVTKTVEDAQNIELAPESVAVIVLRRQ